ncbi:MAG: competence/damage-inducible protein A [Ruminococcaceae bacterium]|nr:competence/damage-inducible protein A [Oscillospiraceae bacterium]
MKINSAEILCVGTEILIGDIINTNAAYISQRLAALGINQYHQGVVGDNPQRVKKFIAEALERADLVITTGGLGPTYDDLTKETIAELMGKKMVLHDESLRRLKEYFESRNRVMTENNIKQAYMPEGCIILENNCGTAPGAIIENEEMGKAVVILPGPPREMKPMFEEGVVPYLEKNSDYFFVSKNINIFGIGESALETEIIDIMKNSLNPTVAPYASDGEVRLRVTAKTERKEEGEKLCLDMVEKLKNTTIGKYIYGVDTSLEEALVNTLKEKNLKIAVAESCTGGMVTGKITAVSGSSAVLDGSVVSYANEIKSKLLGVSTDILNTKGAVSEECALEMAEGVRKLMSADIGISVTGIAGPTGGTEEKPVGTVYIAVSTSKKKECEKLTLRNNGREYIRNVSVRNVLHLALKSI